MPRIIGNTAEAKRQQASRRGERWNADAFLEKLRADGMTDEADVAARLLGWLRDRGIAIEWGRGKVTGSFMPRLVPGDPYSGPGGVSTEGQFYIEFW